MVIETKRVSVWFYSLIVLFYIYSVNYKFLPMDTSKIVWLLFLTLVLLNLLYSKKFRLYFLEKINCYKSFSVFGFLFVGFVSLGLFNDATNYTLAYYTIIYIVDYLPIAIFLSYAFDRSKIEAIDVIVKVGLIQAILIIGMLLIPSFKYMYSSLVSISGNILDYYSYRNVGVTGFANYTVGTTQAMILCLFILDLIKKQSFNTRNILYIVLIFISAAFSSRSSLVVIVIFSLFFFLFIIDKKFFWKKILPFIIMCAFFLILVLIFLLNNRDLVESNFVIKWSIEPLLNFVDHNEFSTKSSDTISSFYFYPGDNTFLFGDWSYVNLDGTYYKSVDAGYMRVMLYMGMPLSILLYVTFIFTFISSSMKHRLVYYRVFSLFFISIILLLHYKGNAFVDASAMFKLYFIYFTSKLFRSQYD